MATNDRIVRLAVLTAAILAAGAFLFVMIASPHVRLEPQDRAYWGARIIPPGPAPNGLPIIPVELDDAGTLSGIPTYLNWYRYNGYEDAPGLRSTYRGDDTFLYGINPERVAVAHAQGIDPW